MEKKTPYYFYRNARYFEKAAKILYENKSNNISFKVIYYIIGHSLELSLKSYLLIKGFTVKELRKKCYGHNLDNLLTKVIDDKDFSDIFKLNNEQIKIIKTFIEIANISYESKQLEYPSGEIIMPYIEHLFEILEILLKGCKRISEEFMEKK